MADTLDQIYMNTAVGASELDDGEQTILTTDANTSYVIKDMMVKDSSSLTGTYLELNGFNVGSVSSNATGSLIVPPSSTLKIKTTDYPYNFTTEETYAINTSNTYAYYEKKVKVGTSSSTLKESSTVSAITSPSNTTDMMFHEYNGQDYFYSTASDSNSSQQIYHRNSPNNTSGTIYNQTYAAQGLSNDTSLGVVAVSTNSNSPLRVYDLNTGSTTSYSSVGGYLSPYPTSSYPRGIVSYGYLWYIPSGGYPTNVYAVNIVTGIQLSFNNLPSINTASSGHVNFNVSLDPVTDKFIVWRPSSNGSSMSVDQINQTKTELDAKTSNYSGSSINLINTALPKPIMLGMDSSVLSPRSDGNIGYQTNAGVFSIIDANLEVVDSSPELNLSSISIDGSSFSSYSRFYKSSNRASTSAEITASGLTAPSFGIQLLGIKSENV